MAKEKKVTPLSENAVKVLDYLKANPEAKMSGAEIAEQTGIAASSIQGILNGLSKRGCVGKDDAEKTVIVPAKEEVRKYKVFYVTEEGQGYVNPTAE